jgi:small subunit ribosomal protein S20
VAEVWQTKKKKKIEFSEKYFKKLQSLMDKYSKKKIIHKNKSNRYKTKINKKIKNIKNK